MSWQHFRRGVALVACLALPAVVSAQSATGTVRGRVSDAGTGRAIADAQVLGAIS